MRNICILFLVLLSCRGTDISKETGDSLADTQAEGVDADGDGFSADLDCDDADASVNPDAAETCDGIDNDCDGLTDDEDGGVTGTSTWYTDADGDGFGNLDSSREACDAPSGMVASGTDCNDFDGSFYPGADESDCTDPNDYNCDGSVGFADADGDGFAACEECDDSVAAISPLATEICDGVDNDCDGTVDDGAVDAQSWYADVDGDGYGDAAVSVDACSAPSAHVADDTDCDDTDSAVNEAATEICDTVDNDCDGWVDDTDPDLSGATTWYGDSDGDGYGGQQYEQAACSQPAGFVATSDDCDDLNAATYPGAAEVCDLADNDCDADIDEGVESTWYEDSDADGYGNGSVSTTACTAPSGYVANALDCDDFSATSNPSAYEICDSVDNDCDGSIDEDAINANSWYLDSDGDGYGSLAGTTSSCDWLTGYADNPTDCDDLDASVNPGATELCDTVDNDCDGVVDEDDAVDAATWFADTDADGYGDASNSSPACAQPTGFVSDATDCDDTTASRSPGESEICGDSLDNDCDGQVDEDDAIDAATWYTDADGDGLGDPNAPMTACVQPSGTTGLPDATDCLDSDSSVYPGAPGSCDGVDADCSGTVEDDEAVAGTAACWFGGSCLDLLNANPTAPSGEYWIDPTNAGNEVQVYCDMTTNGGGYTFWKIDHGSTVNAAAAESQCGSRNMRLLIPRDANHLASAITVARDTTIGPGGGDGYMYILGIYPNGNGQTCRNTPLNSSNSSCNWSAGDGGPFWIGDTSGVSEPNGDNCTTCSMYYSWNTDGTIALYNDAHVSQGGYLSQYYICDTADKQ